MGSLGSDQHKDLNRLEAIEIFVLIGRDAVRIQTPETATRMCVTTISVKASLCVVLYTEPLAPRHRVLGEGLRTIVATCIGQMYSDALVADLFAELREEDPVT